MGDKKQWLDDIVTMMKLESHTDPRQPGAGPGSAELVEDWITIWQSELASLVLDREAQDTLVRMVDGWAAQSRAMLALMTPAARPDAPGPSGPDATARAPAPAAASAERDALIEQLLARVAELERRLASPDTGFRSP